MIGLFVYLLNRLKRRNVNQRSFASAPLGLELSDFKLRQLCPSLYCRSGVSGTLRCLFYDGFGSRYYIRDMLIHGDSRAAIVLRVFPLLVASYCDDLDGVCVLRFPDDLVIEYELNPGTKLVTVLNSWCMPIGLQLGQVARDLALGGRGNPCYLNFWPLIADFLSDDVEKVAARKEQISAREYERCRLLGEEHLRLFNGLARDGRPDRSMHPAGSWFGIWY